MITFHKCDMGIKNIEFDPDFESFEKVVKKTSCRKKLSTKK
jgi:hypothetical protein